MVKAQAPLLLLVDDDIDMRVILRAGLEAYGFRVIEAEGGKSAVSLCKSTAIDLALLDINLEGMSGIDVAKYLREETQVPFVFVSGVSDNETVRHAIAQGALGYFLKPLDVNRLVPMIETALVRAKDMRRLMEAEAHLERAWQTGSGVNVAVGLVMERFRMRQEEAMQFLQQRAILESANVEKIAKDIINAATLLSGHKPQ